MTKTEKRLSEYFREETAPKVYRTIKDRLFRYIFTRPDHKDWTLNLYNALEGTDYTNPDDLELITLENAVYMNMRNDVSVLVSSWNLSFFEHQSSINPNIPLRLGAYYFSTMLKYIDEKEADIYGPGKIILPVPRFHVLYNGSEKAAESEELKLSDLYYNEGRKSGPMLELKVIQHNINGYEDRENSCRQLYEYQWIVETFHRLKGEGLTAEEAIERTIDNLPEDFTIRDLVRLTRSEVIDMWLFEYDEKKHMEMVSRDAEARGALKSMADLIQRQLADGITFEQACKLFKLTEEEIKEVRKALES